MENNKITQELLYSLKRIAVALESNNKLVESKNKRLVKLEKIDEKIKVFNLKLIKERAKRLSRESD